MILQRLLAFALSIALCCGLLTACGSSGNSGSGSTSASSEHQTEEHSIVCTIFPEYDWIREILGENQNQFALSMLMDSGTDIHSFQPTAEDIVKIASCDLFVYVGGASDQWVEDALNETSNPNRKVVKLLDTLGDSLKEEEIKEGMQAEAEENEEEGPEYDEHIWLSLRNAQTLTKALCQTIQELDPAHAEQYLDNCDAYCDKLNALDTEYQKAVDNAAVKAVLFADRFPFRYLVDDYGLDYYAAFAGCSAETEASFETVLYLAKKVDELRLKALFTIEKSDRKIAQTIIDNTSSKNQTILSLDSMQSTTAQDIEQGTTYLSMMQHNLETLRQGLA